MRLRAAAGQGGGAQGASAAVAHEGENKTSKSKNIFSTEATFSPPCIPFFQHCVCQLLFLLLVLMVNYQDRMEQGQARLLHSTIKRRLHASPPGFPNLTSLKE